MKFMQNAVLFLISQGYTQGATKTTENNYQKGSIEIVLYERSFIYRRVFEDCVFIQSHYPDATLKRLKIVTMKQSKSNGSLQKDKGN